MNISRRLATLLLMTFCIILLLAVYQCNLHGCFGQTAVFEGEGVSFEYPASLALYNSGSGLVLTPKEIEREATQVNHAIAVQMRQCDSDMNACSLSKYLEQAILDVDFTLVPYREAVQLRETVCPSLYQELVEESSILPLKTIIVVIDCGDRAVSIRGISSKPMDEMRNDVTTIARSLKFLANYKISSTSIAEK